MGPTRARITIDMKAKRIPRTDARVQLDATCEVTIRLHIEALKEGGFVATSPDVPGLVAEGRSITETVEIAQGLARKIAESCLEHGDALPSALARYSRALSVLCVSAVQYD